MSPSAIETIRPVRMAADAVCVEPKMREMATTRQGRALDCVNVYPYP